jgi:hypothetical protein
VGEKVWKFKYKDEVSVTKEPAPDSTELVDSITAKNHPGWNAPIDYDKNGKDCYTYSDQEIDGLELVGENVRLGE